MSEDNDERQPIAEVLGASFEIHPLPTGWTALEGIVLVKCLDESGGCFLGSFSMTIDGPEQQWQPDEDL